MPNPTEQKRIFLVTAILAVLLVGIFLLRYQRKQNFLSQKVIPTIVLPSPSPTPENLVGIYTITTSAKQVKLGGNFTATVSFSVPGKILDGTDVVLFFDPDYLTASSTLAFGDYFALYPRKEVNNEKGFIKVTAIESKSSEANSAATPLFNASFRAKKGGSTTLSFDFAKGTTNKTTLVEKGSSKNILGSVNEAVVTIEP